MKVVTSVAGMKALARRWKKEGKSIGFVPTMGYLHEGHLSLVRESKKRADVTVVSIFVNPAQFGPNEDFKKYPRDLEKDSAYLEKGGVDCLFYPDAAEIYPPGYRTYVEVRGLQDRLCGKARPGHFQGVATVVLKLFDIVGPGLAFFGAKDAQQVLIIGKMAADLDLDTEVVTCPLVRDPDGLALSSRNAYLSPEERKAALVLSISLRWAERAISAGERDTAKVIAGIRAAIEAEPLARVDYVEAVDPVDLDPVAEIRGDVLIALAVFVGSTRLIDNVRLHA
ncbi:MAG: pantoate--beta-alanine ligase [Acidobacteria bacterium]|nr:pantoate--beta-alanine ligase [Acidobacteriota bacterium]MBE3129209.1 pantoate--beta-alanine ligase [Acidobacteriota bacterium]